MLRITLHDGANGQVTLGLEGQLTGPWVAESRAVCEPLLAAGRRLVVDLAGVSHIDHTGFAFLDSLSDRAVALCGCSPFQAEQLRQLRAAHGANRTSHHP